MSRRDFTIIAPVSAFHRESYTERYSRFNHSSNRRRPAAARIGTRPPQGAGQMSASYDLQGTARSPAGPGAAPPHASPPETRWTAVPRKSPAWHTGGWPHTVTTGCPRSAAGPPRRPPDEEMPHRGSWERGRYPTPEKSLARQCGRAHGVRPAAHKPLHPSPAPRLEPRWLDPLPHAIAQLVPLVARAGGRWSSSRSADAGNRDSMP